MSSPESAKAVINELNDLQSIRIALLSACCLIVYDHLITLNEEYQLIWKKRWSIGKVIFLLMRYHNLLIVGFEISVLFNPNPSVHLCRAWIQWQFVTPILVFVLTEIILQIRVFAIYGRNKWIAALLVPSFIISTTATSVLIGLGTPTDHTTFSVIQLPNGKTCNFPSIPKPYLGLWVPILCFESLLFSLALLRGVRSIGWDLVRTFAGQRILDVIVRDSILYFFAIFSTYAVNLIIWVFDRPLLQLPVGFAVAMPTVMCQRLLFNIGQRVEAPPTAIEFHALQSTRSMLFRENDFELDAGKRMHGGGHHGGSVDIESWEMETTNTSSLAA